MTFQEAPHLNLNQKTECFRFDQHDFLDAFCPQTSGGNRGPTALCGHTQKPGVGSNSAGLTGLTTRTRTRTLTLLGSAKFGTAQSVGVDFSTHFRVPRRASHSQNDLISNRKQFALLPSLDRPYFYTFARCLACVGWTIRLVHRAPCHLALRLLANSTFRISCPHPFTKETHK